MSTDPKVLHAIQVLTNRLSEQTATLFLGAGVNAGLRNRQGEDFPLGAQLSRWITRDILASPDLQLNLDEAAEMGRYRVGPEALNKYIYEKFNTFDPGVAHLSLVSLPWDIIYTTNYDLLIERAAKSLPGVARQIRTVFSTSTEVADFSEDETIYYKLHGSIDFANTDEGRLVLTKEDYRYYELHRKPLFRRLHRDLLSRTCLFVGYSLTDNNFREILEDCRSELGINSLPLSFAIRPGFQPVEEAFWREKYNIQFLDITGDAFLYMLLDTWKAEQRDLVPIEVRLTREYSQVDSATRFPRIGGSFYRVVPEDCTGPSTPELFFKGAEPSWGDIRDQIAPERDAYWALFDAIFPELVDPSQPVSVYLVTGPAGTGKTTMVNSVAYVTADEFKNPVLMHIPGTPLDVSVIAPMVEQDAERIVVIIRHASRYATEIERFVDEATRKKLPLTVILEERKNQWLVAAGSVNRRLNPAEFELGALSDREISRILVALEKHHALGRLETLELEDQVAHFKLVAHHELIIALRELTTGDSFDKIILDEFASIPSDVAKRAYVYVAALGQLDMPLRYENLSRLLELDFASLATHVFTPTARVLVSGEQTGNSRHNAGFNLSTRHPIIASIIFSVAAPDDASKFKIINDIITHLDPGYREDEQLLGAIVRRRELVNTLSSTEHRRAIYERLATILPDDPFVFQHRALLEKDIGDAELALKYARKAVELDRQNLALQNTYGLVLEFSARDVDDVMRRSAMLKEARRIFEEGMAKDPSNPYAYIGLQAVMRQEIGREDRREQRQLMEVRALTLLEDAYDVTGENPIIAGELARQQQRLGDLDTAIELLQSAITTKPNDSRLRDSLIRFQIQRQASTDALAVALEGIKFDPTSWRLHRHAARLLRDQGAPTTAVKGHYDAAIRHFKGDVALLVEAGAYLFMEGEPKEAKYYFDQARQLPVPAAQKRIIRERWRSTNGSDVVFRGKIESIRGAAAEVVAVPQNFKALFWRDTSDLTDLKIGDTVSFTVGFNAHGPLARIRLR